MTSSQILLLPAACAAMVLAACTPPAPIPVDLAEAQCVQNVLDGGNSNSSVTVGFGTGYGGWGGGWGNGWGGTGIAMSTALPVGGSSGSPAQQYTDCVIRKSGKPPVTPFNKRPELKA